MANELLDPPSASSIVGGLAPVPQSAVAASVPTLDEVYSQHKQGQLQDMLRPEWQQPAAFTQSDYNESAYQDEKDLLGKMLKDPVNLGYTSPQIVSAAANSYNPQAMKDMAVAHRATAFLLDTPVEDLDPQKMSVYQKAVAARLGKPAPKTTTDYRNMLAEHFAGMQDMDAAIRDLTVSSVTDALADTNYGKESPIKRDMGSTVTQWMQRHPEIAADPSRHWLLARGAGDIYKNTLEDLGKVRDEAAMTLRVLADFTQGNDQPGEMDELASKVAQLPRKERNKLFSYVALAAEAQQIDRGAVSQLAKNLGESLSRGFDFLPQAFAQGEQGYLEDITAELSSGRVRVNPSVPEGKATFKDVVMQFSGSDAYSGPSNIDEFAAARLATPEEAAAIKQSLDASKRTIQAARELKHFAKQSIDPVRPLARSNSLMGAMERGMYGLAGSVPLMGAVAIDPLIGVAAYQASEFDRIMVENPEMNFRAAQGIALLEGVGNAAIDEMQLSAIAGKSKVFGSVLEGMKGRGVVNYLKRAGVFTAEQFAQENAQDLIAPVVETIASALRQDMPDKDFGAEMKDYLASRPEVFFAVLPLALLGGGFSGANDFKNLDAILSEDRMKMAGLSQTAREYILAATTPEEKVARHGEMWSKRTDEDIAEGKKFTSEKMNAALRERAAQSPLDYRLSVDTTRPDGVAEWVVSDPKGEEVFRSPEYDAAAEIISQHLASRLENDKVGAADLMAWAPTILNDPQSLTLAPKSVQQLFDEFNDKGDQKGIDNLVARLKFANLEGKDYNKLMVLGETTVEQVKEGVYRAVMALRENASPLDAFEELNHGFVKTALAEGKVTLDQLRDWLGQTEKATGTTIARETELEIIENLAKITQDYAAGRIDETTLPASFVDYLKRVVQVFKYALVKYTSLREAFDRGAIGNDFERFLAQSIGLDPQTDMDAVRDKTAAEINPEEQATYSVSDPYKDRDADPSEPLTQTEMDEAVEGESGVTAEPEIDEDAWDQLDTKGRLDFSIRPGPPTEDTIPLIDHADLKGRGKFLFYSDRMRVGLYTGLDPASGISIDLQGGPSYPFTLGNIDSKAGWASTTIGIWQRLVNRVDRTRDGIGVITLYGEGNIRANQTFLLAYMAEVNWAIKSGKLTEQRWLEEANDIRDRALNKKLKGGTKLKDADPSGKKWLPLWTAEWTTLGQAQEALAATTFETRAGSFFGYNETKKGSNKGSIIGSDKLVKEGFPNISDMVAAMEDPRFKGLKYGDMVGAIQFEKGQTTPSDAASLNVRPHLSYDIIVKGSGLGFFRTVSSALSVLKTKKTGFQALRSAETSMADVSFSIREQDTRFLELAQDPEANKAELQRMVDDAARAAGYNVTAKHGTKSDFDIFDIAKGGANVDRVSSRYAFWFSDNDKTAQFYGEQSKQIGSAREAVTKLPAGSETFSYKIGKFDYWDTRLSDGSLLKATAATKLQAETNAIKELNRRAEQARGVKILNTKLKIENPLRLDAGKRAWNVSNAVRRAIKEGRDGVIITNIGGARHPVGTFFGVFNPNQIKSADPVTYDASGNVIPLSERFNSETGNINYSIREQSDVATNGEMRDDRGMLPIKRGDQIVQIGHWGDGPHEKLPDQTASIYVSTPLLLKTLGKKQGTAMNEATGYIESRIRADDLGISEYTRSIKESSRSRGYVRADDAAGIAQAIDFFKSQMLAYVERVVAQDEKFGHARGVRHNYYKSLISKGPSGIDVVSIELTGEGGTNVLGPYEARTDYSIRDQSEIDQIETALGALNRGPEGRLAVYRMAKLKFLDVLRENRDIIDAIKATKIDVKAQLSPEVEKLDTELRDTLADLEVEELGATEEALNENEDRKQAKLEGATSREQITEINRSARERASVIKSGIASKFIEKRKALRGDIAARKTALKTEANQQDVASNAMLREKVQSAQFRQAVAELDGLLKALPTEVMGRVGGFSRLANMPTTDAGLGKFFLHRIEMVEREIERYLKKSYDEELDAILERSKPKKFAPGEKPKGIGAEIQRVFAAVREAVAYTPKELEAKLASLDAMLADPDISPEREAELQQISALITLAGDWKPRYEKSFNPKTGKEGYRMVSPGADSGRRASAVEALKATWAKGYAEFKRKKEAQRQERDAARAEAVASTGKDGQYADRLKRSRKEHGIKGFARKMYLSLLSWDQLLGTVFGNETYVATKYSDDQRRAENNKDDAVFAKMDEIDTLLTKLSKGGTRLDGERLRYTLATEELQIGELQLTQMEMLTASMMWEQEDGRRHMLGVRNNEGDLVSDWSYDQEFMDKLEAKLSPEARAIRQFLWAKYEAEYNEINAVYKEINGIDLPKVQMYSPILVKPVQAPSGMVNDAVTGMAVSAASISPGALRTRSSTAVAEPEFRDALATYMAHTQQMEHWKNFAPMTIELNAILRNRNVQNAIEEAASREATTVLNLHLDMFAQGGNRDAAGTLGVSKDFGRVTGRAAQVALVGRIGTLLIQFTQLGAAVAEMPVGAYALRLSKLLSGQLAWGDALSSDYIQRRIAEMPPIVRQGLEGLKSGKPNYLKHQVARLGQLISGADGLFTAGTYAIVLDYHRQQAERMGMNAERAEAYANNVAQRATDRLAQPTRAGARSIYERTSNGVAGKLLWAFSSEPRKNLALAAYSVANRPADVAARTIGGLLILNTLAGAIIRNAWKDAKDDDDDEVFDSKHWNPSRFAMALLTEPMQGLPVVGAAAQEGAYAASGNYYNPSNLLSITRAIQAVFHIDETLAGDRDADQMMGDLDAILSTLGLANENIAAVASLSHLAKDLFGLTENTAKTITSPPE